MSRWRTTNPKAEILNLSPSAAAWGT